MGAILYQEAGARCPGDPELSHPTTNRALELNVIHILALGDDFGRDVQAALLADFGPLHGS